MAAKNSRFRAKPVAGISRLLGRWEWVALPELGISCMKARLAPEARTSRLATNDLERIDLDGRAGSRFRIYPLADDERTFLLVEARLAGIPERGRGPRIRTLLTLGAQSWTVELRLVPRRGQPVALTLGRDALGGPFAVDPEAEALLGSPLSWPRLANTT